MHTSDSQPEDTYNCQLCHLLACAADSCTNWDVPSIWISLLSFLIKREQHCGLKKFVVALLSIVGPHQGYALVENTLWKENHPNDVEYVPAIFGIKKGSLKN